MTVIAILQFSPVPAYFCCGWVKSPIWNVAYNWKRDIDHRQIGRRMSGDLECFFFFIAVANFYENFWFK